MAHDGNVARRSIIRSEDMYARCKCMYQYSAYKYHSDLLYTQLEVGVHYAS